MTDMNRLAQSMSAFTPKGDPECETCLGSGMVQMFRTNGERVPNKQHCVCVLRKNRAHLRRFGDRESLNTAEYLEFEQPDCRRCRDTGWVTLPLGVGERDFGKVVPCEHPPAGPESERIAAFAKRAGVPETLMGRRIAQFLPESARERVAVEGWLASWPPPKPFLVLLGKNGTGKTHLALGALFDAYLTHGIAAGMFLPVTGLLRRLRATMDANATETETQVFDQLARTPLLVLDDVGAEKFTDWTMQTLFDLIDRRYRERMATVFTTNLGPDQLEARVGSRLADVSGSVLVLFDGPDYRQRQRGA